MSRSNSFLNKTPTLVKCWVICLDEDAVEQEMIYLSLFVAQLTKLPVIMDCFFLTIIFFARVTAASVKKKKKVKKILEEEVGVSVKMTDLDFFFLLKFYMYEEVMLVGHGEV